MLLPRCQLNGWRPAARHLWVAQLAAIALAQVAVSGLLRLAWLARPDPFGSALVGKLEWYWFHALALDSWQACRVVCVGIVLCLIGGQREVVITVVRRIVLGVLVLLTALSVVDGAVMRFLGMHLSPALARTYASLASARELPGLLGKDAGGPYVDVVLLLLAPIGVLSLAGRATKRAQSWQPVAYFAGLVAVGCLFAFVLWPGGFREWRLSPPLDVLRSALREVESPRLPAAEHAQADELYARTWTQATAPSQAARFPLSDFPLVHLSDYAACARGLVDHALCTTDRDGDGSALQNDCDDRDAAVHPGARDIPGDGIDQDCSGSDKQPSNVVLFILETHRALNVGHLFPDPQHASSTPRLDELAGQNLTFTRAIANGTPTIGAFMTLHTSLLPHPTQTVASSFNHVRMRALPQILREHGYYARFFSAADPAWDNQTAWLRRWYDAVDYDRAREQDGALFTHIGDWFEREQPGTPGKPPFFVAITTRTNHYPFHRVEGVENTGPDTLAGRIADTMRYTDKQLGLLLDRLATQPFWRDTVVIVTGDHGFPLGEHGYTHLHETAHIEATGVPLVIAGEHPKLQRWRGQQLSAPASHIDVAPTVLDLAGIDASGSFMGHSLLDATQTRDAVAITASEWALSRGDKRLLMRRSDDPHKPAAAQWYDRLNDPQEQHALLPHQLTAADVAAERELSATAFWMAELYEQDLLWPTEAPSSTGAAAQAHASLRTP